MSIREPRAFPPAGGRSPRGCPGGGLRARGAWLPGAWCRAAALLATALAALATPPAVAGSHWPGETSLIYERAGWDPGSKAGGEIQESVLALRLGHRWGALDAQLEIAQTRAARSGTRLGPETGGALLVRYAPSAGWLLQGGVRTPSGTGRLSRSARSLAALLGDPLFALPNPDPVHGWLVHAGAIHGWALSHETHLLFGLGGEWTGAFEPGVEGSLDPADRLLTSFTLQTEFAATRAEARLSAAFESDDEIDGETLQDGRRLLGAALAASRACRGFLAGASVEGVSCGRVSILDPEIHGVRVEAGPGFFARMGLEVGSEGTLALAESMRLRPAIAISWSRLMPEELPTGDGWSARLGPRLELFTAAGEFVLGGAWGRGSWRDWEPGGYRAAADIRGWMFRLEWTRGAPGGTGDPR